ncbi:MAG: LptF/LptG family permease [Thermodesulfovibrionia bacterium]
MKVIRRYFLMEFFKYFLIIILSLSGIMMVAEFFDKADEFYSGMADLITVLEYLLLHTPRFLVYSSPIASLLSILITIGIASRWGETIAIRASGVNLRRLFSSFLIISLLITLSAFFMNEVIVPSSMRKATWIRNVKILRLSPRITYGEGVIWLKGLDGSIIRIGNFVEEGNGLIDVSIFSLDKDFRLIKRIEAEKGEWRGNEWILEDATEYDINREITINHKRFPITTIEEPDIFRREAKSPDEMNFVELYHYYSRLERAGFKNNKYIIRLYEKLAYPMINLIMVLFGISLSLNARLGGGIWATGIGIITVVLYWLVYSIGISLGNTGAIPAWTAPWLAPILFTIAGSLLFLRIRE